MQATVARRVRLICRLDLLSTRWWRSWISISWSIRVQYKSFFGPRGQKAAQDRSSGVAHDWEPGRDGKSLRYSRFRAMGLIPCSLKYRSIVAGAAKGSAQAT